MTDLRPNSEIADGIHWIKDGYVNLYITEHGNDLILIDTGINKKAKPVFDYIKTELESRKISKIMLTHHHVDHTRGLHTLHEQFHSRIFVSHQDHDVVIGQRKSPLPNKKIHRPLFLLARNIMKAKPVPEVEITRENEVHDDFTVYHFPGHTLGSLGFMKGTALFPGDAAVTNKKGEVKLGPSIFTESLTQARASLNKIANLKFDMILSGHGTPILEGASDRTIEAVSNF